MGLGSAARVRRHRPPRSPDGRMTLVEHLRELRHRLIVSCVAIVVGMIVAFVLHKQLLHVLTGPYCRLSPKLRPLDDHRCQLFAFGVTEGFTVTVKLCLWSGLVLASPVWLWQLWRFITPGLYRHERRWAIGFVAASVFLFCLGGVFAWLALTRGLHFLLGFANGGGLTTLLTFGSYLSFVIAMVVVFAVSFEFPLAVVMLNLAGIVSFTRLRKWTRGILFAIFVFAGGATPSGDPITMLALAVPMCLLYAAALAIAYVHDKREERRAAASPYAGLSDDEASPLEDPQPVDPSDPVESGVS